MEDEENLKMDGTNGTVLDISSKANKKESPAATYKSIPEMDIEDEALSRPKSLVKVIPTKDTKEADGADEKMLPKEEIVLNSTVNLSDVKISPNEKQNGDAKLDIGETKNLFGGMNKEELMKYANDPFWVRLRWFLFISFWLLWAAMLIGAIMIIYAAPKCDPPPPRTWWQEGPLTEVKPDVTSDDIKSLDKNIKGFILSLQEDPYIGFDDAHEIIKVIKQANQLDFKVIVDLDPTTSSVWFESSENKNDTLSDYYIWKPAKNSADGVALTEPNNWLNRNNRPSWKYSQKRKEYYYCPFDKPHLNFRNENVTKAFSDVIVKFLEYGASGISIRNAPFLFVDPKFADEKIADSRYNLKEYNFYTHTKTENLPEVGLLLNQWRMIVKSKTEVGPFMMKEELPKTDIYKVNNTFVVDLPLQAHTFSKTNILVKDVVNSLNHTFNIDNIEWPLWKVNTTTLPKDVLDIVTYLLPGVPLVNSSDVINTQLLKIRESPSIMRGICSIHSVNNGTVFSYIRVTSGNPGILVALNTQNETVTVNFSKEIPVLSMLPEVTIQLYSKNFNEPDFMDVNAKKDATAVPISPKSAIVLSYVPKKKD